MFIESTDCTVEQVIEAAQYALTADSLTYDLSNGVGISGQERLMDYPTKCPAYSIMYSDSCNWNSLKR